jgi:hypothetical protein
MIRLLSQVYTYVILYFFKQRVWLILVFLCLAY